MITINIHGYYFVHFSSPRKAGGVGTYLSKFLKFTLKDNLQLNVTECEDLWFQMQFPGQKKNYIFAITYRRPSS